jgi:hypothetical protein
LNKVDLPTFGRPTIPALSMAGSGDRTKSAAFHGTPKAVPPQDPSVAMPA